MPPGDLERSVRKILLQQRKSLFIDRKSTILNNNRSFLNSRSAPTNTHFSSKSIPIEHTSAPDQLQLTLTSDLNQLQLTLTSALNQSQSNTLQLQINPTSTPKQSIYLQTSSNTRFRTVLNTTFQRGTVLNHYNHDPPYGK